jgi:hypothetical protein
MSPLEEEHAKAEAMIDSPALSANTLKVLLHILGPAIIIGLISTHCSDTFAQAIPKSGDSCPSRYYSQGDYCKKI